MESYTLWKDFWEGEPPFQVVVKKHKSFYSLQQAKDFIDTNPGWDYAEGDPIRQRYGPGILYNQPI